jgi:hypothetical protein
VGLGGHKNRRLFRELLDKHFSNIFLNFDLGSNSPGLLEML